MSTSSSSQECREEPLQARAGGMGGMAKTLRQN